MNLQKEWQVCDGPVGYQHRIVAGDVVICDVRETRDARLIASVHALLESLIWMVENDDTNEGEAPVESLGYQSWNDYNAYWIEGLNRARAAIAKARGEAQ